METLPRTQEVAPLCCQVNPHIKFLLWPSNDPAYERCLYCNLVICKPCCDRTWISGQHIHDRCYKLWQKDPKYQTVGPW